MWPNLSIKKLLIITGVLCLHMCVFFWLNHYQYPTIFKSNNSSANTISVKFIDESISTNQEVSSQSNQNKAEVKTIKNDSDTKKSNLAVKPVNIDKTKALPINSDTKKKTQNKIQSKVQNSDAPLSDQQKALANSSNKIAKHAQKKETVSSTLSKKAEPPNEQEPKQQNEPFAHLLNQNLWLGDYNGNAYHQLNPNKPHVPSTNNRNNTWSPSDTANKAEFNQSNTEYLLDDDSFLDNIYTNEQANQNEELYGTFDLGEAQINEPNGESPMSLLESAIQYKQHIKPQYPTLARRMNIEGEVTFKFTVDENGYVIEDSLFIINSTHDSFSESVQSAILQSTFYPMVQNGVAIPIDLIHTHYFNLDD